MSNPIQRSLVLNYLSQNCHTASAKAFLRDSSVRHLDADGDEIMQPDRSLNPSTLLTDSEIRHLELRELIQIAILSGRVEDATALLNEHFPAVLSESPHTPTPTPAILATPTPASAVKEQKRTTNRWQYFSPTSIEPAHLNLNLRIAAFIEACRTVPLPYTPTTNRTIDTTTSAPQSPMTLDVNRDDPEFLTRHQTELIAKAQKLYAAVEILQDPTVRAVFSQELKNVCGLLAYKVPEDSPMALYMSQTRREAVAHQINAAVLHSLGSPIVSSLELYVRYTTTVWDLLHEIRVKPPPPGSRPPGVKLPPTAATKSTKAPDDVLPPFNLTLFLDSKD